MLIVFIVSSVTHTMLFNGTEWISFLLGMEPPDAERIAVRSRDRSLVSSLKERVSRRNLISQSARPDVDILSRFLNV